MKQILGAVQILCDSQRWGVLANLLQYITIFKGGGQAKVFQYYNIFFKLQIEGKSLKSTKKIKKFGDFENNCFFKLRS